MSDEELLNKKQILKLSNLELIVLLSALHLSITKISQDREELLNILLQLSEKIEKKIL